MGGDVCSIPGCRSKTGSNIIFCRLPSGKNDTERRLAWLSAISRGPTWNPTTCLVCERHFRPDDWEKTRVDGTRKIKRCAVPSVSLPLQPPQVRKSKPLGDITNVVTVQVQPPKTAINSVSMPFAVSKEHSYASECPSTPLSVNEDPSSCSTPSIFEPFITADFSESSHPPSFSKNPDLLPEKLPKCATPPTTVVPSLEQFEAALASMAQLIEENRMLKQKAASEEKLRKQVFHLRKVLKNERKVKERLKKNFALSHENIKKLVSKDQLECTLRNSTRGRKFSNSAIEEGLVYKSQCGTSAYASVAKRFHLPAPRTLQLRTAHIKFRSGILWEVIGKLQPQVPHMHDKEKDCILTVDEMAIQPNDRLFDPSTKSPVGSCTLPRTQGTARKVVVVMIAGVSYRWKMVVAYYFSGDKIPEKKNENVFGEAFKDVIMDIVIAVEKVGLRVAAVCSDMGNENRAMWKALKICGKRSGEQKSSIEHPCSTPTPRTLHFLPDVPHLFKNIVAMMHSNKIILLPDDIAEKFALPSNVVDSSHLEDLMTFEQAYELKVAYRMKEGYFSKGHFEKMQVGTAKAIFNHRTKVGLNILAEKADRPHYKTTAWFVGLVVRWFELVTSRCHKLALSLQNEKVYQDAIAHIKLTSSVFQRMKVGKQGVWKPAQEGVMIACNSILMLQEYFLVERGYVFILTSRFSQDCLENLFSQIRRRQPLPNVLTFKNILKEIIISRKCFRPPKGSSYDFDEGDFLLNMLTCTEEVGVSEEPAEATQSPSTPPDNLIEIHCPPILDLDVVSIVDDHELLVLYDMAGATVHQVVQLHKIPKDCACIQSLLWKGPLRHPYATVTLEKNYKPGALLEVSNECFIAIVKCEIIFRVLRSVLLKQSEINVFDVLCHKASYVWDNFQCTPCHKEVTKKLMLRFFTKRFKQYGLTGKTGNEKKTAVFSSKSIGMRAFAKNCHIGGNKAPIL